MLNARVDVLSVLEYSLRQMDKTVSLCFFLNSRRAATADTAIKTPCLKPVSVINSISSEGAMEVATEICKWAVKWNKR